MEANSEQTMDDAAAVTLELLETRLRAIEYALYGHQTPGGLESGKEKTAATRLKELEQGLNHYTQKTQVIQELLKLHAQYPDLFQNTEDAEVPSLLDADSKAAIVLSFASSFLMTASSLTSITDTPIPDASISAKVMIIAPQVQDLAALQASQLKTIASLKERTAAVLERFYSVDILQTGEYWADVETRVDRADHAIRRAALAQKQDDV